MTSVLPTQVGIVGGGRMGVGIAHAFLLAGSTVSVIDVDEQAAARSAAAVRRTVERSAELGVVPASVDAILTRLAVSGDYGALEGSGLVIEAVPEVADLKARVLASVAEVVPPDAVLATNTSSLSIEELATALPGPHRFIGLHFFNPVPASLLVEIVLGRRSAPSVVDRAQDWVRQLGKTPIIVHDSPGFATSRLGVAIGLEAIRMLEERVASAEDIDAAMVLGYKHPVGPLRLTDLVGLDVRLSVAEHLSLELGQRFAPPALLREKVAAGELGRKTGQGFYTWPN